jgi:hypothetical protein
LACDLALVDAGHFVPIVFHFPSELDKTSEIALIKSLASFLGTKDFAQVVMKGAVVIDD